jgi:MinD superfamily P-loop ATPase
LQYFIHKHRTAKVLLVDCDVEEPNDKLFFPAHTIESQEEFSQMVPVINTDRCTFCRKCVTYCEFNAIVVIPPVSFAEVNPSLCHSCGACLVACPADAIDETGHPIGTISRYHTGIGNGLLEGKLKIGSAMQTLMIKEVKKNISPNHDIVLLDAPPGTSCPVVESVADVDFVILVTEPTPFGLHDLKLTVALLEEMHKPFGVVVNKAGLGNDAVYHYLKNQNIELLGELPFDKNYARRYATGDLLTHIDPETERLYLNLIQKLDKHHLTHEGHYHIKR